VGEGAEAEAEVRRIEMKAENWKAIAATQAVQLSAADQALLDKVQASLALSDREFLDFMVLIGKIAPGAPRLVGAQLR
jgi:hypothetical protein